MAVIALTSRIDFPIAGIRAQLKEHLPHYRWQCGERDEGGPNDKTSFDGSHLILGRSAAEIVMINAAQHDGSFAGEGGPVPPHRFHITLGNPTLDDRHSANRMWIAICLGLIQHRDDAAIRCQLEPGGPWLDAAAMRDAAAQANSGADLTSLDRLTGGLTMPQSTPVSILKSEPQAVPPAPPAPPTPAPVVPPAPSGLPSIVLMLNGRVDLDWVQIGGLINELDPDGGWQVKCEPHGRGFLLGRGGMIALLNPEAPVPAHLLEEGFTRSWWFEGDRARIMAHRSQLIISSTVDDDAAYADKQGVAKVISLIACMAAHHGSVAGVYNSGIGTIYDPGAVADMIGMIANNEIPIPLWTWCAWHSLEEHNVSFSTGGFSPLLGYEIEVWNAPVATALVQDKISALMRYLLDKGPVIQHGDTCGVTAGDKAIRCFQEESRADRPAPTRAMIVEFGQPLVAEPAKPEPVAAPAPIVRAAGGFGRKGL